MAKADIQKILLTGEDRPDLYSVHRLQDVAPLEKPQIVAEFHGRPINYPVDGGFAKCDLNLIPEQNWEFEFVNRTNNFTSYFNDTTDPANPTLASFEIINSQGQARWINYKMFGITMASQGIPEGNTITYHDVFPGIDLKYIVDTWRLKEDIIIKQPVEHYGYKFTLKLDLNIIMEPQEDGSINFVDAETQERLWGIAKPYVKDAEDKVTQNIRYILGKELYNGVEYDSIEVVIEDAEFIQNATFPITIDPTTTFNVSASGDDGVVHGQSTSYPPGYYEMSTTYTFCNTGKVSDYNDTGQYRVSQSLLRFNTSSIPDNSIISSASLQLYFYSKSDGRSLCCEYYNFSSITNECYMQGEIGTSAFTKLTSSCTLNTLNTINLLNVNSFLNKTGYTGFRFGIDGGAPYTSPNYYYYYGINWYSFDYSTSSARPTLTVTYNTPPTTPTLTAPNGGETYNESATITWQASTDSDGDFLTYHLQYSPDNGTNWYDITSGVSGTSYNWNTSALPAGSTYLVRIRAYDGYSYSSYDQSNGVFTIQHITDKVNIGGVWKEVDKRWCNIGGVWKEIDTIYCNIGGVWKSS